MFRFCLVGFGRWGAVYYDTINRLSCCEIDSIVVRGKSSSIEQFANVPIFHDIKQVIASRQIDGFIIATPPDTHFNLAESCLSSGYPVLVEKPFTTSHAQANQLANIAILNNTICMAGYQHLFATNYNVLKNLVDFNSNGVKVYSEGLSSGPFRNNVSVFRDWGSHEFSMAIDLFNEIPFSYTIKEIVKERRGDERGAYLLELQFSSHRRFISIFGNTSEVKRRTLIASYPGGWGYINGLDQGGCVVMRDGAILEPDSILSTGTMPLDAMISHFISQTKLSIIDLKSLKTAVEIASIMDEIEIELKKAHKNV